MILQTKIQTYSSKFKNISDIYAKAVNSSETEAKKELYRNLSQALEIIFDYNESLNKDQKILLGVYLEKYEGLQQIFKNAKDNDSFWDILMAIQNIYSSMKDSDENIYKYLGNIGHAFGVVEMIGSNIISIPDEQLAQLIAIDVESTLARDLRTYIDNKDTNIEERYKETFRVVDEFSIAYLTPLGFNSDKLKEIATDCDFNDWKKITDFQEKHNGYIISLKQIESFIDHIDKPGISDFIIHEFNLFEDIQKVKNPTTKGEKALNQIIDFYIERRGEISEKCATATLSKLKELKDVEEISDNLKERIGSALNNKEDFQERLKIISDINNYIATLSKLKELKDVEEISDNLKERIGSAVEQKKSDDTLKAFEEINKEINSYKELSSLLSTLSTNSNKIARTINVQLGGMDENIKKNIISFANNESKDKIISIMNNVRTVNSEDKSPSFITRMIDRLIGLLSGLDTKNTKLLNTSFQHSILKKRRNYEQSFTHLPS